MIDMPLAVIAVADAALKKNTEIRAEILMFEHTLRRINLVHDLVEPDCPLTHHFAPGVYGREIFIPKGSVIVGKIHKHTHLNMLMQGHVTVKTEAGLEEIYAPKVMISQAGTKRALYTHEDTIWVTVHLTDSRDLDIIEDEVIAKTYEEFDRLNEQRLPVIDTEQKDMLCLG